MVEYKGTPFKDIANLKIELNTSHVTVKLRRVVIMNKETVVKYISCYG